MSEGVASQSQGARHARVERVTKETAIVVDLRLADGRPPAAATIATPVPFLSHMLDALARHGALGLEVEARGDVEIDDHHTVEDVGLVLGAAIDQALGPREHGTLPAPGPAALARAQVYFDRGTAAYSAGRYNDAVLAHGSPPVKYVRALMLGLPVE